MQRDTRRAIVAVADAIGRGQRSPGAGRGAARARCATRSWPRGRRPGHLPEADAGAAAEAGKQIGTPTPAPGRWRRSARRSGRDAPGADPRIPLEVALVRLHRCRRRRLLDAVLAERIERLERGRRRRGRRRRRSGRRGHRRAGRRRGSSEPRPTPSAAEPRPVRPPSRPVAPRDRRGPCAATAGASAAARPTTEHGPPPAQEGRPRGDSAESPAPSACPAHGARATAPLHLPATCRAGSRC